MQKIIYAVMVSASLLLSSNSIAASGSVEDAMKQMNKSYRTALKQDDVSAFLKNMHNLKATARSILDNPVEGYDKNVYFSGISMLIDEVSVVEKIAEKEGLDAGKMAAKNLDSLMRKYHSKLGVH